MWVAQVAAALLGYGATLTAALGDEHEAAVPLPDRIVLASGATETEAWSAGHLSHLLGLPVVATAAIDADGAAASQIAVGYGPERRQRWVSIERPWQLWETMATCSVLQRAAVCRGVAWPLHLVLAVQGAR
jgi:hypothetical protein